MKKVLVIALFVTIAMANSGWAQTPDARPSTVQPGTLAILDTMAIVAKSQTVAPAPVPLLFLQAPAAPPAPARPATVPATPAPARPTPGSAPPAAPATAAPVPPQAPSPGSATPFALRSSPNVRFDVTITDTGGAKPVTKNLSLTIWAGNSSGSIRNSAQVPNPATATGPGFSPTMNIPLNVDVRAVNVQDNGIRASVTVEYQPYVLEAKTQPGAITTNATTVFVDGRKTQILVTADPISDRKTTIEVTATILK